jgi:hypothetical protein
MKVIATSEVPSRVPYVHFGYTAVNIGSVVMFASGILFVFIVVSWLLTKVLKKIFGRRDDPP